MNFLLVYIELAYIALQYPGELSVVLSRAPQRKAMALLTLGLASFSLALSRTYLRENYDGGMAAIIVLGTFLQATWMGLFVMLLALLLHFYNPREGLAAGSAETAVYCFLQALLPLTFCMALCLPVRLMGAPWLYFLVLATLFGWSAFIMIRTYQYQYELPLKKAGRLFAKSFLIMLLLPVCAVMVFLADILTLVSYL